MLDDDASADLYETAITTLASAGWTHYEIANWARFPDLVSWHNAVYWRNGDYLGIGAGAHGHVGDLRTMNHLLPETYCAAVEHSEATASNMERIEARTALGETMMLGLRLVRDGVDADAFHCRHGQTLDAAFGPTIRELIGLGMLERRHAGDRERIRLTPRGMMIANDVVARFL